MNIEIQKLHNVWLDNRTIQSTSLPQITFDDLTNSIISSGPFYYYIVDFFDMSISYVSPSIFEIHGINPEEVTFNDILGLGHTDYIMKTEASIANFFNNKIGSDKLLNYKINYCMRGRLINGEYVLFNHQAIMLTIDDDGKYGKSLNIHTRIDHLSTFNTHKYSLIGLNGEPSYMNLSVCDANEHTTEFSKREIDIIKLIGDGLNNNEIAEKLFISALTVKKHRNNILTKSNSKNTAQLIKNCILQGLI